MTKLQQREKEQSIERLRAIIKPGDTVHTLLRRVSSSGMSRCLDVCLAGAEGVSCITYDVALATGSPLSKEGWLRIGGCGQDMGFAVVHCLAYNLFPDGFGCIGKGENRGPRDYCPSNDHTNFDRDYTPHREEDGGHHWHKSGDYALRHRWL